MCVFSSFQDNQLYLKFKNRIELFLSKVSQGPIGHILTWLESRWASQLRTQTHLNTSKQRVNEATLRPIQISNCASQPSLSDSYVDVSSSSAIQISPSGSKSETEALRKRASHGARWPDQYIFITARSQVVLVLASSLQTQVQAVTALVRGLRRALGAVIHFRESSLSDMNNEPWPIPLTAVTGGG